MSDLTQHQAQLLPSWQASEGDYINQVVFSPDGDLLASACADGSIAVYSQLKRDLLWRQQVHGLGATALAWSPDSVMLASGGQDSYINIWDARSGDQCHRYAGGRGWVGKLAWSAKGLLAAVTGKELKVWNSQGETATHFEPARSTLTGLEWQADGSLLTSGYSEVLRWYPTKPEPVKVYSWKGSLLSLAVSPDGSVIAAGSQEGAIHFWRTKKKNEFQMDGYHGKVRHIGWSPDNRFFFTAGGAALIIWDCEGKGPEGTTPDYQTFHEGAITALVPNPCHSYVASGAENGSLYIYDALSRQPVATGRVGDAISTVAWHPNERALAIGSASGRIEYFDIR